MPVLRPHGMNINNRPNADDNHPQIEEKRLKANKS